MSLERLSEQYHICCDEIQRITTMLYEEVLHDSKGIPVHDWERVIDSVKRLRQGIKAETDTIIEVCREYSESKQKNEH